MLMTSIKAWKSRDVMAMSTSGTMSCVSSPPTFCWRWRSDTVKGAQICLQHKVDGVQ